MEFFDSLSFKALIIWRLLVYAMVRVTGYGSDLYSKRFFCFFVFCFMWFALFFSGLFIRMASLYCLPMVGVLFLGAKQLVCVSSVCLVF